MDVKQVIVFRKDLLKGPNSIRKGKFGAQVAHASVGALLKCFSIDEVKPIQMGFIGNTEPDQLEYKYSCSFMKGTILDSWLNGKFTKIVVGIDNEEELLKLQKEIEDSDYYIPNCLITDCGQTEFHDIPTITCLGIGPYDSKIIDKFTGNLSLL